MLKKDWLARWENNQTGWHQADGNSALRKYWPRIAAGSRVLVPLCGKSLDLLWLAEQGYKVTGVELSELAARAFFQAAGLDFEVKETGDHVRFHCTRAAITIVCGDYFKFTDRPFDALYDRASLVALPAQKRKDYVRHTQSLLKPDAAQLLITLEYDQSKTSGPPFSVSAREVTSYWAKLKRVASKNDIENAPPRFRNDGIEELIETAWVST